MHSTLKLIRTFRFPVVKHKSFTALSRVQRRYFSTCLPKMTDKKENRIVWVDLEVGTVVNTPSIKRQRRGQRLMQVYGDADAAADA